MGVKCIVLDDDPVCCAATAKLVENHPQVELLGKFTDPAAAQQFLYKNNVKLLIADLELPGITGIDFVKALPRPPEIIFITAHKEYAADSYELHALDYLLKPFSKERFNEAMRRALALIGFSNKQTAEYNNPALQMKDDHFFIRSDAQFVRIKFADIYYIEALKDFVKIHTVARNYIALVNLKHIEAAFPPGLFLRTHRSYLVSIAHITAIGNETIETVATSLPLGQSYKDRVFEEMLGNKVIKRN